MLVSVLCWVCVSVLVFLFVFECVSYMVSVCVCSERVVVSFCVIVSFITSFRRIVSALLV